ncbi:DoxX family protein [Fibrella sp. WM1]|uniref:DoxX family protein n=1 Tax=Fibrella musci TaxID=3242485 RepID=UPI003521A6E2
MPKRISDTMADEWAYNEPHPAWEARTAAPRLQPGKRNVPETTLFRFILLYVGIQLLPIDATFIRNLFRLGDQGPFNYTSYLFDLSKYAPHFFGPTPSFTDWGAIALLALAGTFLWNASSRNHQFDNQVYAWLRVAVRYRLALAVLAYGFIKLFPIQAPLPSLSNLNTAYGDHSAWKLFSLSLGIVPGYESFLGSVEVLGGLLLLNRKTTVIGTLILLPFLGNVFFSNLAYEGGEYVYSGLLLTFGLFLFGHDAVRLFRLVSLEAPAQPNRLTLALTQSQQTARLVLKGVFLVLVVGLYGFTTARSGQLRLPQTPGLPGAAGLYRVDTFTTDGQPIPYSKTHPTRWQDVVFETWNTLSIRSNQPVALQEANTEELPTSDAQRDYERAGSQGRHYYRYTTGQTQPGNQTTLTLTGPNQADALLVGNVTISRPTEGTLLLSGTDAKGHAIEAKLTKVTKKYLLQEAAKAGRRGALTL